jgi:hypothetical protein
MIQIKKITKGNSDDFHMEVDGKVVGDAFPSLRHAAFFSNWLQGAVRDGLQVSVTQAAELPKPPKAKRKKTDLVDPGEGGE